MFRNYFKTSLRNLIKNPLSSVINVLGLAAAIGCCMVVYAYLTMEFTAEDQHLKADRIFMVKSLVDRDGEAEWFGISPTPIGLSLKQDFPQISKMCRIEDRNVVVKREQNVFQEWTRMVDPEFLEMFDFNMIRGNASPLEDRGNVIINEKMVKKYFGDENPLGQTVNMRFPGSKNIPLKVTGVVRIEPMSTSFEFDFLTNFSLLEIADPDFSETDWSENINGTFILMDDPKDIETITGNIRAYSELTNSVQKDFDFMDFDFEPVATLYERSHDIRWDISRQADVEGQWILSVIAILMLALACLNYLNIAISSAVKRLKEIGIRKVIGASRQRLILQFMVENILLAFIALVMGIILGGTFFLPGLNNVFAIEMGLDVLDPVFFVFIIALLLLTAISSGAYPAMYISSFQVVSILKGKLIFGRKNLLSRIFLSFQFVIACLAVVCGVLFTLNTNYQMERPWGYEQKSAMMVRVENSNDLLQLKNHLSQNTDILSMSMSAHHLGVRVSSTVVEFPDRKLEGRRLDIDADYIGTMKLQIMEGRDFRKNFESDRNSVLVNETFARTMEWEDPIDKTFRYDSIQYRVIGLLKDFHFYSFWNEIEPTFLRLGPEEEFRYLAIRTHEGKLTEVFEEVETTWATMFPDIPFNGDYQSQLFDNFFRNINGHKVLMLSVAIIATLMTCLGLYGLVSLNVSGRLREFSIRKVLGADIIAMSKAVGSHFIVFLMIAIIVGGPLSYITINGLFEMIYEWPMPISALHIIGSLILIVLVVVLTISSQLFKVIRANPTEGLRVE